MGNPFEQPKMPSPQVEKPKVRAEDPQAVESGKKEDKERFQPLEAAEKKINEEIERYGSLVDKPGVSEAQKKAYFDKLVFYQDAYLEIGRAKDWMNAYKDKSWDDFLTTQFENSYQAWKKNPEGRAKQQEKAYRFRKKMLDELASDSIPKTEEGGEETKDESEQWRSIEGVIDFFNNKAKYFSNQMKLAGSEDAKKATQESYQYHNLLVEQIRAGNFISLHFEVWKIH